MTAKRWGDQAMKDIIKDGCASHQDLIIKKWLLTILASLVENGIIPFSIV